MTYPEQPFAERETSVRKDHGNDGGTMDQKGIRHLKPQRLHQHQAQLL